MGSLPIQACGKLKTGPDVDDFFKDEINKECMDYIRDVALIVSKRVSTMDKELKDSIIKISKSSVFDLSFNRRLIMKDGPMRMNWEGVDPDTVKEAAGPIDPDLFVISIYEPSGKIEVLMVNFTLHPAILVGQDWLWSKDYINYLNNYLKDRLGHEIVVFFANGAEGNINHINYQDRNQERGFNEARRIGESLGKYVIDAIDSAEEIEDTNLKCLSAVINLPLRSISKEEVDKAKKLIEERGDYIPSLLDGVPDEIYAREIIKLSKIRDKYVETQIQAVRIGDNVIATLPGEVFVEFGLRIKKESPFKNTLVFGLANDCVGYIPTSEAFDEGGYEIKTATTSKLDRNAGDILASEVIKLVKSL
jgi:neutral ceramidase